MPLDSTTLALLEGRMDVLDIWRESEPEPEPLSLFDDPEAPDLEDE